MEREKQTNYFGACLPVLQIGRGSAAEYLWQMVKGIPHEHCEAVLDSPVSNAVSCMRAMELRKEWRLEAVMGSVRKSKMQDAK